VRRRGAWESFRSLFRSAAPEVLEWTVEADDWWVEEEAGGARDTGAPLA
jgi:hypothetical protein